MDPSHKPSYIVAIGCSWLTFSANTVLTFLKLYQEFQRGEWHIFVYMFEIEKNVFRLTLIRFTIEILSCSFKVFRN